MSQISVLFQSLASLAAVAFLVLAAGTLLLTWLRQPIERVRCIQWTFAALVVALLVRQSTLLPKIRLGVLPNNSVALPARPLADSPAESSAQRANVAAESTARPATAAPWSANLPPDDFVATAAATSGGDAPRRWSWGGPWLAFQLLCVAAAAMGGLYGVTLLIVGHWRLRRMRCDSEPADESLGKGWRERSAAAAMGVHVLVSRTAAVPMTFGVLRPVIIVPQYLAASGDTRALAYCLSHEFAHIQSRDVLTWFVVHCLQPLLWFQPAFWYLRRELRTAQDQLADHFAAGASDRTEYATFLSSLARRQLGWSQGMALSMADRRSSLHRRIELLLAEHCHMARATRRGVLWGATTCLAILAVSLGVLRLERASAARQADPVVQESSDDKDQQTANEQEPAEDTPAVELSYTGKIVDSETKKPIAGATVIVRRSVLTSHERRIMEESQHTTDANGGYHFTIPPEQAAERGLYIELDVECPDYAWKKGFGYSLTMIRKNERLGEKPFFSHVELHRAEPLTGRIVNPQGEPVSGAIIQAYSKTSADDWEDHGSFFKTSTDQDGRFRLQLVKGGPSVFWIVPKGYAPLQVVSGVKRGDWGDIQVSEGIAIRGKVLSATGKPVAGVWVNLEDRDVRQEVQLPVATYVNRSAETQEDGSFTLRPMKAGKYAIQVENRGSELVLDQGGWSRPRQLEDVFVTRQIEIGPQDADRPFTIQAIPHVEFHAQYVDSKGKPCSGHEVFIAGQFDGQWFHTNLNPDSQGKIDGKLPHGLTDARLQAITNEHSSLQIRLKKDGPLVSAELSLGTIEDDLSGIEIIRYTAPIVQVKPVDEQGAIVKGCKVAGLYADGKDAAMKPIDGPPTNVIFEHQPDGRHRTIQMIPNRMVKFVVTAEGYQEASQEVKLTEGEETELTLVLKKADAPTTNDNIRP